MTRIDIEVGAGILALVVLGCGLLALVAVLIRML